MSRRRLSKTVDDELLRTAPSLRSGTTDAAMVDALLGITALTLTLAACGSDASSGSTVDPTTTQSPSPSASVDTAHNSADVSFAQDMIVHHEGAVAMAELAATRASSGQVKNLAARIKAAQQPEITQMTSWLTAWGAPIGSKTSTSGMDHPSSTSASGAVSGAMGMMSDEQMTQLKAATGTTFDRMFLQLMTVHHQGAIEMAKAEQAGGSNRPAVALATSIETSQSAQVTQMGQLLQSVGS